MIRLAGGVVVTIAALVGLGGAPAASAPGGAAAAPGGAAAAPRGARVLFHLADPRIGEASGIAAGIASPGVLYVHNDSGDVARFFALDAHTGRTLATYRVPGATNVDWEDIAVAPDSRGVPSIWLGDIGDNAAARSEIDVYRVDEPHLGRSPAAEVTATTSAPQVWRLRYPAGAADAESLAVSPTGAAYLVTKSLIGISRVYAVPSHADASRVQLLHAIGTVRFGLTATPGGPNQLGQLTATAADLSRDGGLLAVRTYTDAYLWRVRGGDVAAAVRTDPVRVALPAQPQGEGIALDGARLLIDSEGVGSAVRTVGLPAAVTAPSGTTPAPTASTSARSVRLAPTATDPPRGNHGASQGWVRIGAGVLVVALVVLTSRLIGRHRRRG